MELKSWEKVTGSFFYVGFKTRGAGTVTSALVFVAGWFLKKEVILISLLLLLPLSFYLAYRFEKCIGHDPSSFTMDEVIGCLIILYFIPHKITYYFLFFIVWRLFDIFKPVFKPVEKIQQGVGIMADDIIAAALTTGVYFLFIWLL